MTKSNRYVFLKFFLLVFVCLLEDSLKAQIQAMGESSVYKKGDEIKAYYEAIADAQRNAVIAYGGNISYNSSEATDNNTLSSKSNKDKKYTNEGSLAKKYQALLSESVNSSVKTEKIIRVDTIKISSRAFKIKVTGNFKISPNEAGNAIGINILKTGDKVKIALKENTCQGEVYIYLSEYFNSRHNNFIFSKDYWPLAEDDYLIEINENEIVLKNKHEKPNTILKKYYYEGCLNLVKDKKNANKIFDEMLNDIYLLYVSQLAKPKK